MPLPIDVDWKRIKNKPSSFPPDIVKVKNTVISETTGLAEALSDLQNKINLKQDKLLSGINIKSINNTSLLGAGNLTIQGGAGGGDSNIDGGNASSIYLIFQNIDGGAANG